MTGSRGPVTGQGDVTHMLRVRAASLGKTPADSTTMEHAVKTDRETTLVDDHQVVGR